MSARGSNYPKKIKDIEVTSEEACKVYWAHLDTHTDMTTQGYIGITKRNLSLRVSGHLNAASDDGLGYVFHKAIRKYGSEIIFEVIAVTTIEGASNLEKKLRPRDFIGWNTVEGGLGNGSLLRNYTCTDEFKEVRSSHMKGVWEEGGEHLEKILAARKHYFENTPPWRRKGCNGFWSYAGDIQVLMDEKGWGVPKSANYLMLGSNISGEGAARWLRDGWKPLSDERYTADFGVRNLKELEDEYGSTDGYHKSWTRKDRMWMWEIADDIYDYYQQGDRVIDLRNNRGLDYHCCLRLYNWFDKGWVPLKDPRWIKWRDEQNGTRHNIESPCRSADRIPIDKG